MICPACLYVHAEGHLAHCAACGAATGGTEAPTPFVGRGRALAWLESQLDAVSKTRRPRFVVVAGQPGVGRSRLLGEFQRRHDNPFSELQVIRGFPLSRAHAGDPFRPFGRLLHVALGLDERMAPEARQARLERAVRALEPPAEREAVAGLAQVLGLSLLGDAVDVAPEAAVRWYLRARAQRGPVVVLLEAMERASADGLRLFAALRAALDVGPVLVIAETISSRLPQLGVPMGATLMLPGLDRAEVADLLRALTQRAGEPPPALLDATMAATGGRPGAVAEAAAALVQAGLAPEGGTGWGVGHDALGGFSLPLTQAQEAGAHLAQLDDADQRVLAHAAFVGPVFWLGAVLAVLRADEPQPGPGEYPGRPDRAQLDEVFLRATGLGVLERRADLDRPGEPAWGFVGAGATERLLSSRAPTPARPRHRLVAAWMASRFAEASPSELLALAGHHEAGGDPARAAEAYQAAGAGLRAAHAVEQAILAYDQALACLEPTAADRRIDVHHALGVLHDLAGRPTRSDACFEAMLADAWRLDHRAKAGAALNRLGRSLRARSRHADAARFLAQGRAQFAAAGDQAGVAASVDDLGQVALLQGDLEGALGRFREALEARQGDHRGVALSLTNIGRLLGEAGDPDRAEASFREAAELRTRIGDDLGWVDSMLQLAELLLRAGRLESAQEAADAALAVAQRIYSQSHLARALAVGALLVMTRTGAPEAALMARQALGIAEQLGDAATSARALRALALTAAEAAPENALAHLERAIERARRHGDRIELSAALRLAVTLQLRLAEVDPQARSAAARAGAPCAPLSEAAMVRLEAAAEALDETIGVLDAVNDRRGAIWSRRSLAAVVEALGDVSAGAALRAEAHRLSEGESA